MKLPIQGQLRSILDAPFQIFNAYHGHNAVYGDCIRNIVVGLFKRDLFYERSCVLSTHSRSGALSRLFCLNGYHKFSLCPPPS